MAVSSETQTATCFCTVTSSVRYGIITCEWNETKLKLLTGPLPLLPRRAVGGVSALFGTLLPGTVEHSCRPLASKLRLEVPPLAGWQGCHVAPTPWRARSFPGASLLLTVSRCLFSGGLAAVNGAVHSGFKCPRLYKTMEAAPSAVPFNNSVHSWTDSRWITGLLSTTLSVCWIGKSAANRAGKKIATRQAKSLFFFLTTRENWWANHGGMLLSAFIQVAYCTNISIL